MSKRIGEPYDPALRKTEHGSRLYQTWRKIRNYPHYEDWDYFPNFYKWAMKNGYKLGAWLQRIDESKPYGTDNFKWYFPQKKSNKLQITEWNKTVNRIRKHYGMPPLEGTSYED